MNTQHHGLRQVGFALLLIGSMVTSCTDHEWVLATDGQAMADELASGIGTESCEDLVEEFPRLDDVSSFGWPYWCEQFLDDVELPLEFTLVRAEVARSDNGLVRSESYVYWYRYLRNDGIHGLVGISLSASSGELGLGTVWIDTCRSDRFCQL